MNNKQIKLLSKMKILIKQGKKRFANRKDRSYLDDLEEIGITVEQAWFEHIIYLNKNMFFVDPKPNYRTTGNTLIFKNLLFSKCFDFFLLYFLQFHYDMSDCEFLLSSEVYAKVY